MAANKSSCDIEKVSKLLNEASQILSNTSSLSNNQTTSSTLQNTLLRANNMLRESSASGLSRRLGRSERLRSAAGIDYNKKKSKNEKAKEKKAIEFALLRCFDEDVDEEITQPNLKWDSILTSGMLMLTEDDDELTIRSKILDSLKSKYPIMSMNDFEFVKVRHKAISTLQLGSGTEYNYPVVKKMAGQGLLYVKVKQGFECTYDVDQLDDKDDLAITAIIKSENDNTQALPVSSNSKAKSTHGHQEIGGESKGHDKGDDFSMPAIESSDSSVKTLLHGIHSQNLTDPVEILRFLQKSIVHGRCLDIESESQCDESYNDTNFICVDRQDLLQTTFSELATIKDYTMTFEVEFIGEMAKDLGGPRKEWIRLMNTEMKRKYFDNGLRELLSQDYYYVGIMLGIALLQNGALPAFVPHGILDQLLEFPNSNSCIASIQKGLEEFGLCSVIRAYPILLHLLRPSTTKLSSKMLIHLLKPKFSEEGSSALKKEKEVYSMFIKYIRQVALGQREPISLASLLIFTTGASEEPVLGFSKPPSILFETPEVIGTNLSHQHFICY